MDYKVGDKVIISKKSGNWWNAEGGMDKYIGETVTIKRVEKLNFLEMETVYRIYEDDGYWAWHTHMIHGFSDQNLI